MTPVTPKYTTTTFRKTRKENLKPFWLKPPRRSENNPGQMYSTAVPRVPHSVALIFLFETPHVSSSNTQLPQYETGFE